MRGCVYFNFSWDAKATIVQDDCQKKKVFVVILSPEYLVHAESKDSQAH